MTEQDIDNPILALQQCFAESNLTHKLLSPHAVQLQLKGDWQEYDILFTHQPREELFSISGQLAVQVSEADTNKLYRVIGRMNRRLSYGHFTVNEETRTVGYSYTLPEAALPGLDVDGLEDMIENAVIALENLFPVVQSLLFGAQSVDQSMEKYLQAAQGSA